LSLSISGCEGKLAVFGRANAYNVAAACAMASEFGVALETALQRIAKAPLSPHRSRLVTMAGRVILDDCYNANPASVLSALESLALLPTAGRRFAVLGSMFELGASASEHHAAVLARASELQIDKVWAVGDQMRAAQDQLGVAPTAHELAAEIAAMTREGDAILFKGSRGVALEAILDLLASEFESAGKD
jgi:UDP-N-acetylmuramoyl-tripeptide--D-alanyl-D-alanine ligase